MSNASSFTPSGGAAIAFDLLAPQPYGTTDWQRAPVAGVIAIPFGAPVYQIPENAQAPEDRDETLRIGEANWALLKAQANVWGTLTTPYGTTTCFLSHWGKPTRYRSGTHLVPVVFRR